MRRFRFRIWFPAKATCGQIFGMDGVTYWCKDWGEPEEAAAPNSPEDGFELTIVVKPEYVQELEAALESCGGSVVSGPEATGL